MGPNQRFKNELDTLIDRQLLPEDREVAPGPDGPSTSYSSRSAHLPAGPRGAGPETQNGRYD
ncbi:hypothetical protein GCM10011583_40520 [Streptomyces camponoticapitis]|uniref:Uncharacterized protein n=1 Tax=Streptomyces camponoticapitis TaxID=1616125 RepID=A0ABQ2EB50_9ACTN|nr:hypothetical protein [Streptomyces camponoticapitis]GGK04678.1 hypothetical protein GCM10011583_40520 [Streptomyces camponoticapitis]